MAAFFKTKSVLVSRPVGQLEQGPQVARMVDIQPISAVVAYEKFKVDLADTFQLFDDFEAANYYQTGGEVLYGQVRYSVKGVRGWDTIPTNSHVHVLLERIQDGA